MVQGKHMVLRKIKSVNYFVYKVPLGRGWMEHMQIFLLGTLLKTCFWKFQNRHGWISEQLAATVNPSLSYSAHNVVLCDNQNMERMKWNLLDRCKVQFWKN